MFALIGGVLDPLPRLRTHIRQIAEGAQRPKALAYIADRAFDFSFFPSRRYMTSAGDEAVLAREGEEARIETNEIPFMLGHRRREIIEPDFASTASHGIEGVNVTADKRFEVLAVSKLHVQFAAVAFDQA